MRILLINKFLYPKGGDAINTLSTGELLRENGHEVDYWGMDHPLNPPDLPLKRYFVPYVDLNDPSGIFNRIKIISNIFYSLEAKRKLEKFISVYRPDIVHLNNYAHQISPSILHVLKKYKIPCIMTMHDYKLVCPSYSLLSHGHVCEKCRGQAFINCIKERCVKDSIVKSTVNTAEMYLHHSALHIYDWISVFISPSMFMKEKIGEMGFKGEVVHIPHFVKSNGYIPQYRSSAKTISYFGRLSKEKGVATLIKAMKSLPELELNIVGDGPIRNDLINYIRQLKLNNIKILGFKYGEDLNNIIRNSLFVVVPSECYEVFGKVIGEAFVLGKPVIASRIGGIPELVNNGRTGMTYDPGDAEALALAIRRLLDSPDKIENMGKAARRFAEADLNPEKHYQRLMNTYERAIEIRRPKR